MPMFALACSAVCGACDTLVLFSAWRATEPPMQWVVPAMLHCERTPRSPSWLCSDCSLYPSQSHLQLKRGPVREEETAKEEEERKRDIAIETESRSRESIYTWVMDLLRDDFFVLGGGWWLRRRQTQCLCWKVPFTAGGGGVCPGRVANEVIYSASAPSLTTTSRLDGTPCKSL